MRVSGRRLLKIAGWALAVLVVLTGVVAAAVWFGGARAIVWLVEHPVSTSIGREIRIAGPLAVEWGSPTRIVIEDVHVANASWGSQPEMFAAKRLEITIFVCTLLFGPTRIPSLAF